MKADAMGLKFSPFVIAACLRLQWGYMRPTIVTQLPTELSLGSGIECTFFGVSYTRIPVQIAVYENGRREVLDQSINLLGNCMVGLVPVLGLMKVKNGGTLKFEDVDKTIQRTPNTIAKLLFFGSFLVIGYNFPSVQVYIDGGDWGEYPKGPSGATRV
jgi:hypothetical protein